MRVEWFGIAVAAVEDGRGALAIIGAFQNVLVAHELPASARRALILSIEDDTDNLQPGDRLELTMRVHSPSDDVLVATGAEHTVGEKRYPHLPGTVRIPAEARFGVPEHGTYAITCDVSSSSGDKLSAKTELYVVQPTT